MTDSDDGGTSFPATFLQTFPSRVTENGDRVPVSGISMSRTGAGPVAGITDHRTHHLGEAAIPTFRHR